MPEPGLAPRRVDALPRAGTRAGEMQA